MLCRALLTIIAISYLICVLILSGLQKEDLDVHMLKKLEHHGLDIDDINNENLRKDCFEAAKTYKEELNTTDPIIISTTTEKALKKEYYQQQVKYNDKDTNKTELEAVIKYIMDLQKSENTTKANNVHITTTKKNVFNSYDIPQSSNLKYIFSDLIGYDSSRLNKNKLQTPTTDKPLQFFSQNILRLWNTYSEHNIKDLTTSKSTTLQTSTLKTIEIQNKNDPEIEIVKKIISEYISKNQIISTTTTSTQVPPKRELDIARISDEIRRFLAHTQNKKQNKLQETVQYTEDIKTEPETFTYKNKTANKPYTKIINEIDTFLDIKPTIKERNIVRDIFKNESNLPTDDTIGLVKPKRNTENDNPMQNTKEMSFESKHSKPENYTLNKEDNMFKSVNDLYTNMGKSKKNSLPSDIIKEIAENVKAIILKDLKKDISTLTPHFTSSTTETPETTTQKRENKAIEATHMIEKFMELFQHFKSTNEKTIIAGNSQMKVTESKNVKHEYKGPVKIIYSTNKSVMSPYGVRSPVEQFAPILVNKQYNDESNINTPKYIVLPNIQNTVYQIRQVGNYNVKTGLGLSPITIQTNSFEVAPLGIPIEKPLSMVNQNIIVTTRSPNLRPRLDTHHRSYVHQMDRYKVDDDFKDRKDRQNPLFVPKREFHPRDRDDVYTLDENENFKSNKSDRYDNRNYPEDYKPHFSKSDYDRMKLRNQEIKRFHERLENTNESKNTEEKEDCCTVRVASRQQLPLAKAKKRSRYDDVHFRNFLKTQQKVNDMLERILATKTKSDGPRSVETP